MTVSEQPLDTYLIIGLGNPGRKYRHNRHNVGFMLIDRLAAHLNLAFTRTQSKALVTDGRYAERKVLLAKPQTFMNEAGKAVKSLVRFYKIPPDHLLVFYDDLDLPLGTVRFRLEGGAGGQKGMKSIIDQLERKDFLRLRIGIGRPPGTMDPADYVLHDFSAAEAELLEMTLDRALDIVLAFLQGGIQQALTLHSKAE